MNVSSAHILHRDGPKLLLMTPTGVLTNQISFFQSHLNSLLKTAEELKIKGLADVSGRGLHDDDDSISYAPAPPRIDTKIDHRHEKDRIDRMDRHERDRSSHREREKERDREDEYDAMFDSSLLENSVSINVSYSFNT